MALTINSSAFTNLIGVEGNIPVPYVHTHERNFVNLKSQLVPSSPNFKSGQSRQEFQLLDARLQVIENKLLNETENFMKALGLSLDENGFRELQKLLTSNRYSLSEDDIALRMLSYSDFLYRAYSICQGHLIDYSKLKTSNGWSEKKDRDLLYAIGIDVKNMDNNIPRTEFRKMIHNALVSYIQNSKAKTASDRKKVLRGLSASKMVKEAINQYIDKETKEFKKKVNYRTIINTITEAFVEKYATTDLTKVNSKLYLDSAVTALIPVYDKCRNAIIKELQTEVKKLSGLNLRLEGTITVNGKEVFNNILEVDKDVRDKFLKLYAISFMNSSAKMMGNLFEKQNVEYSVKALGSTGVQVTVEMVEGNSEDVFSSRIKSTVEKQVSSAASRKFKPMKTYHSGTKESQTDAFILVKGDKGTATARVQYKNSQVDMIGDFIKNDGSREIPFIRRIQRKAVPFNDIFENISKNGLSLLSERDIGIIGYLAANYAWLTGKGKDFTDNTGSLDEDEIRRLMSYYIAPLLVDEIGVSIARDLDSSVELFGNSVDSLNSNLFFVFPNMVVPTAFIVRELRRVIQEYSEKINPTVGIEFRLDSKGVYSKDPATFWAAKQDAIKNLALNGEVNVSYGGELKAVGQSAGREILSTTTGHLNLRIDFLTFLKTSFKI